jgi:hypothetical protein
VYTAIIANDVGMASIALFENSTQNEPKKKSQKKQELDSVVINQPGMESNLKDPEQRVLK